VRVLIVGSGGREHALAWALHSRGDATLFCTPGNPGIATVADCIPCDISDTAAVVAAAEHLSTDLVMIGPEAPLAAGLVDALSARGLRAFGPTRAASELEASKVFMKTLCARYEIPTAPFRVFDDGEAAAAYVRRAARPLAVKADGLCAGKGVVVAGSADEGVTAVETLMLRRRFGDAGARIVVEEVLPGQELSVFAVTDGVDLVPLIAARDYKRLGDGDRGPNTGGMGAVAPAPGVPDGVLDRIVDEILAPALWAMAQEGRTYRGVLFAGVMLAPDGPRVLEFNVRFGDPEAQALLPLLDTSLLEVADAVLAGHVNRLALRWRAETAVCVALCAAGYPDRPRAGDVIERLDAAAGDDRTLVFHAGTAVRDGRLVTAGGRVLNVVGTGGSVGEARSRAYGTAGRIEFAGKTLRRDIGIGWHPVMTETAQAVEEVFR
jgi:phosphoribosylamine--glycine ligase